MQHIRSVVDKVLAAYGTRCPYQLADNLGIEVLEYSLKKIRGLIVNIGDQKYIVVKNDLPAYEKRAVVCHEIGHHLLHPCAGYFYIQENTHYVWQRYDLEADMFAARFLLDELPREGETIREFAARKEVPDLLVLLYIQLRTREGK